MEADELCVEFTSLESADPVAFRSLLNDPRNRRHLIPHEIFDHERFEEWLGEKLRNDALPGCCIRAIHVKRRLVGWCGVQALGDEVEIAAVIDHSAWGIGPTVFKTLLLWARELGHERVLVHLLKTRPRNRFLERRSSKVYDSEWLGKRFTSYCLPTSP